MHPAWLALLTLLIACSPRAAAGPIYQVAEPHDLPRGPALTAGQTGSRERRGPGELRAGTITIAGADRTYLLYVPTTFSPAAPAPLIFVFHGGGMNASEMQGFGLNVEAERDGALVVYPNGSPREEGGAEYWWSLIPGDASDVRFVAALLERLQSDFAVDPARIYATGVSNGGYIGYRVACELADRVVAVGIVASASPLDCQPRRPVSVLHIHGTDDPLVPYQLVPRTIRAWRRADGCSTQPTATTIAPGVTRESTADCREEAEVTLYSIAGGTHTWPNLFPEVSPSPVDATALIAAFFRDHHR